jgi:hypothetical protein
MEESLQKHVDDPFHAESTTIEQQISYLTDFVGRSTNQKIRIEKAKNMYSSLLKELTESIIDQNDMILQLTDDGAPDTQLSVAKQRLDKDMAIKDDINKRIEELNARYSELTDDLQAHLLVLTGLNLAKGNFHAHQFGLRDHVKQDKDDPSLFSFDALGSMEASIATDLNRWRDSSQMSLHKKEG